MMDYIIAGLILWCIFLHGWIWHLHRVMKEMTRAFLDHVDVTTKQMDVTRDLANATRESFAGVVDMIRKAP
jgi:hypothetical protein